MAVKSFSLRKVYEVMNYLVPSKAEGLLSGLVAGWRRRGSAGSAGRDYDTIFSLPITVINIRGVIHRSIYEWSVRQLRQPDLILESRAHTSGIKQMPFLICRLKSSHYMYLDEEVPFLSIVLKGTIRCIPIM